MSKDWFNIWEERAKLNTKIIEQQQTKTKMTKEEVIKIVNNSLDELLEEVGNDYEYNGCSHLVEIIIKKLNQNKDE